MAKEILRFKGLSLNRDEQAAGHGELSVCAGVELHDGALRPSVLEGSMLKHEDNRVMVDSELKVGDAVATLLYVHETASYRHFICKVGNALYWFKKDGTLGNSTAIHTFASDDAIVSVNSVGNTLVVLAESGVHYALWKDTDYKYLGTEIPFLKIWFKASRKHPANYNRSTMAESWQEVISSYSALRHLDIEASEVFEVNNNTHVATIKTGKRSIISDGIKALVNQNNNIIVNDGHIYAPFLIRYCYRLYDGSMVMHSAPVFVCVSHPYTFDVQCDNLRVDGGGNITVGRAQIGEYDFTDDIVLRYTPQNVSIEYCADYIENRDIWADLKNNWSDIVSSIDVFISPIITREKLDELTETFSFERDVNNYGWVFADIPVFSNDEYLRKILDCSTFYQLTSWQLEDIGTDKLHIDTDYHDLNYDKAIIPNITSQALMNKDDYHTHCRLLPTEAYRGMYIYNHRLNLYGMNEKLFEGFNIHDMIDKTTNYGVSGQPSVDVEQVVVEIKTDNGNKIVKTFEVNHHCNAKAFCRTILFYPDSRAIKMVVYADNNTKKLEVKLEPSNFLNAAVAAPYFYDDNIISKFVANSDSVPDANDLVPMPNKVITSEVDDPYYFPIEGRNTVGIGAIIGLAAVTRALSQGQVGDHDLIAFCTDGIWVLKVSSTGTYSAMHNISREVCTNTKSICQLDQSVVFATQRSLSRFVESNVISMSDMLDGPIRNWSELFGSFFDSEDLEPIRRQLEFGTPAVDIFNHGSIFYDYAGARVVVLPEHTDEASVAFVFSVRDQTWSTMPIPPIRAVVPGYPSPFVQLGGDGESEDNGKVIILDKSYDYDATDAEALSGLILTRTLTFSDTMDVIRGFQHHADSEQAPILFLFGSNDQRRWNVIGQTGRWFYNYLPGQSYRFFRIAIYTQMKPSEEYQDLVLEIVNKYGKL